MITICIPMSVGRHFLFGCAVLAVDASHPCPAATQRTNLAFARLAREHRVPPRPPVPDGP
jgi:hypothetical protein